MIEPKEKSETGYYVMGDGSVWSARGGSGTLRKLKPQTNPITGYQHVCLRKPGGGSISRYVHTLVLSAFSGPRPTGMQCMHLNGIKTDNRIENLQWGTASENAMDRERDMRRRGIFRGRPRTKMDYNEQNDLKSSGDTDKLSAVESVVFCEAMSRSYSTKIGIIFNQICQKTQVGVPPCPVKIP